MACHVISELDSRRQPPVDSGGLLDRKHLERRVFGRDGADLVVARVRPGALEEDPDLCLPPLQIGAQDRYFLVVGELPAAEALGLPAREGGGGPGGSWSLFFRATCQGRFGGLARSIAEGLAGAASAPAQCRPGIGHRAAGCMYPQIAADEERPALDGPDGGRDIRLLAGNTWRLVVQGPGRAAADDLGYQRRARGVRGDPRPVPGIEYLRKPAQALGEMPASLRVEVHGDLAARERLPRPRPG